jgi:hypothetical protein
VIRTYGNLEFRDPGADKPLIALPSGLELKLGSPLVECTLDNVLDTLAEIGPVCGGRLLLGLFLHCQAYSLS